MIHYRTCCLFSLLAMLLALPLAAQERWERVSNGLDAGSIARFGFSAEGDIYAAGGDGIYQLVDGNRWEMLHRNLYVYLFQTAPDSTMIMAGASSTHHVRALYRSDDNGRTWQIIADTVAADPQIASDGTLYYLHMKGLYRSGDMGRNWDLLETPAGGPDQEYHFGYMAIEKNGTLIFTPGDSLIYVSTDKGNSWTKTGSTNQRFTYNLGILPDGRLTMSGSSFGISVSSDHGRSWQDGDPLMTGTRWILPNGNHVLYYPGRTATSANMGLYGSVDSGRSWSRIDRQVVQAFAVAPDGTFWRSILPRVHRSIDEGKTWEDVTTGMSAINATLPVVDNEGILYTTQLDKILDVLDPISMDGSYSIFRSVDKGSSWQKVTDSMDYVIRTDDSGRLYGNRILPEDQRNGYRVTRTPVVSHDGGRSWRRLYPGLENNGAPFHWNVYRDGVVIGREFSDPERKARLVISLDGGNTWRRSDHPFEAFRIYRTEGGTMMAFFTGGYTLDSSHGIYRSLDSGTTWEQVIRGVGKANLEFSSDTHGTIYIEADPEFEGRYDRKRSIFRSLDDGASFEKVLDSLVNPYFLPTAHGTMFVRGYASGDEIPTLKTDDRGATWSEVSLPLEGGAMRIVVPVTGSDGAIYSSAANYQISNTAVLHRSLDDGQSWHMFNEGLPDDGITGLLDMPGGPLFVSMGPGIYRRSKASSVPSATAEKSISFDVVPNPVDGNHASVVVSLELPQHLRVTLHDMLGRTVGLLADGEYDAGEQTIAIAPKEIATGSYIVRVSVGEKTFSRMVIIR